MYITDWMRVEVEMAKNSGDNGAISFPLPPFIDGAVSISACSFAITTLFVRRHVSFKVESRRLSPDCLVVGLALIRVTLPTL